MWCNIIPLRHISPFALNLPACVCMSAQQAWSRALNPACPTFPCPVPCKKGAWVVDGSCQHLGAPGKDASGRAGDGGWAQPEWLLLEKSGTWQDVSLHFHFTLEICRRDDYWITQKLFNVPVWKKQCFFLKKKKKRKTRRVKSIFGSKWSSIKSDHVLKTAKWHT